MFVEEILLDEQYSEEDGFDEEKVTRRMIISDFRVQANVPVCCYFAETVSSGSDFELDTLYLALIISEISENSSTFQTYYKSSKVKGSELVHQQMMNTAKLSRKSKIN